ncbi:hypothetical protein B0H17DRAFT_1159228 [Mycena rosella]|uniref:Uncharacterized protein n=1 Tax=Mycena rosella TaxID=1033263 RepID=A0AAD7DKZ7_MYCRO|nr:hypothetical protein B0H17DRAFT_1159228 [Mycena rosella]
MATPITVVPSSPTMSAASSFDMVSSRSRSSTASSQSPDMDFDDSDDEIVWSVSEESLSSSNESSLSPASDDDFVVLSRPRSPQRRSADTRREPTPTTDGANTPSNLASDLARLSVNQVSATIRRNKKAAAKEGAAVSPKHRKPSSRPKAEGGSKSPPPTPTTPVSDRPSSVATLRKGSPSGKPGRRSRKNKAGAAAAPSGFGARPIVDDISEQPDSASERGDSEFAVPSMYEAAASYINSFLADQTSVCRLTLLQSLIIELGLASSSMPASLTAAKAMLKSQAFLNVGEYLDARQRGPAAVQSVMHPSKTALIKDLRKKRNATALRVVKESGLQVLLVSCYH